MENFASDIKNTYKKILLADDNHMNAVITSDILRMHHYKVDVAANGMEVLKILKRKIYDVILMDVQMPILDGIEATKRIRYLENKKGFYHVPIIAFTAHALQGDKEKFLSAGMDGYISKPFEIQNLYNVIEEILKNKTI